VSLAFEGFDAERPEHTEECGPWPLIFHFSKQPLLCVKSVLARQLVP